MFQSDFFNCSTVLETTESHKSKRTSIKSSSQEVSSTKLATMYFPISPFLIIVLWWRRWKVTRERRLVSRVQLIKFLRQSLRDIRYILSGVRC